MTAPAPLPWNMRPDETSRAFMAFELYRDMGTGRTLERVNQESTAHPPLNSLKAWSTRHAWVDRVAAFDAEAARRASAKSLDSHAEVRARQAGLGRMMQARGAQRIATLDPASLEAKEARALATEGAKMERDALMMDQPTKLEVGTPGEWRQLAAEAGLTEEEVLAEVRRRVGLG